MKIKAFILALVISTSACSVLPELAASGPTTPTQVVPTFYLILPTPTEIPPTETPVVIPTATLKVKWPVATLKVVSSLPMTGSSASTAQSMVNAETLRLQQAGYQACGGKYQLAYEAWDNVPKGSASWDATLETENARKAADAPDIIAYLGGFDSDAAKLDIPILGQAGPLVILSPGSTYPGLTQPVLGIPDEPDKYYPAGIRNFARVVPTYDGQARVSAVFMSSKLGVKSVFILDDEELYGQTISYAFEAAAKFLGMQVLGHEAIDPKERSYELLMYRIAASNNGHPPDAIFASMLAENNAGQLLKDKVAVLGDNAKVKFMGPDGIHSQAFIESAGPLVADGVYASAPGLPFPDGLTDSGEQFVKDYKAAYGRLTEPSSLYAYEAMNVLLKAIEDVCASGADPTNRKQVRDAVFAIHDFSGVLGTWTFDQNGDTTLIGTTIYAVKGGSYQVVSTYK